MGSSGFTGLFNPMSQHHRCAVLMISMKRKHIDGTTDSPPAKFLRLLAADELGRIKAVEAQSNDPAKVEQTSCWGDGGRKNGIVCISQPVSTDEEETCFIAVARKDGACELMDSATGKVVSRVALELKDGNCVVGIHVLTKASSLVTRVPAMLSCTQSGSILIHQPGEDSSSGDWQEAANWQGPQSINAIAVNASETLLALAADGSELSVWSLETKAKVYAAKGAKPDRTGLMELPCNTAVAFMPSSDEADLARLIVGNRKHKIRLYDMAQRRPKLTVEFGESRITALAPESQGGRVWAADAQGRIGCLDLKLGKMQRVLKGSAGSVRSLSLHPSADVIASAGLDRFLRLHRLSTGKLASRIYLKQCLVGAVFCPDVTRPVNKPANDTPAAANQHSEQEHKSQELPPPPAPPARQKGDKRKTKKPKLKSRGLPASD